MKNKSILLFCITLLIANYTYAQNADFSQGNDPQKPSIVVAIDPNFPPMEYLNNEKIVAGFDIDLANAIGNIIGYKIVFQSVSWSDIFDGLNNEKYDAIISSVGISDDRSYLFDFSIPYMNAGNILVVKSTDTDTQSIEDLSGKRVGVFIEKWEDKDPAPNCSPKIIVYQEIDRMFSALISGKLDGIVISLPNVAKYRMDYKYPGQLRRVGAIIADIPYGIAFKKGDARFINKINSALIKMTKEGTINALLKKWDLID